jgi:hypothetical protein
LKEELKVQGMALIDEGGGYRRVGGDSLFPCWR